MDYEYLGNKIYLYGEIGNEKLTFVTSPYVNAKLNEDIYFKIDFEKAHFFNPESKNRINKI